MTRAELLADGDSDVEGELAEWKVGGWGPWRAVGLQGGVKAGLVAGAGLDRREGAGVGEGRQWWRSGLSGFGRGGAGSRPGGRLASGRAAPLPRRRGVLTRSCLCPPTARSLQRDCSERLAEQRQLCGEQREFMASWNLWVHRHHVHADADLPAAVAAFAAAHAAQLAADGPFRRCLDAYLLNLWRFRLLTPAQLHTLTAGLPQLHGAVGRGTPPAATAVDA